MPEGENFFPGPDNHDPLAVHEAVGNKKRVSQ